MKPEPYAGPHADSKRRKMARPKDLLGWFLTGFREEMPDVLHSRDDVWRDARHTSDAKDYEPVGGSLLGTPRDNEEWRRVVDGEHEERVLARLTDYGVTVGTMSFGTPMRAALKHLSGHHLCTKAERRTGKHRCGESPFMAITLRAVAGHHGDWQAACDAVGIYPLDIRWTYVQTALHRLFDIYREEPEDYYRRDTAVA